MTFIPVKKKVYGCTNAKFSAWYVDTPHITMLNGQTQMI